MICTRRAGKLYKARSRLYRSQILQVNTCWKALDEIHKIYILLQRSNLKISARSISLNHRTHVSSPDVSGYIPQSEMSP